MLPLAHGVHLKVGAALWPRFGEQTDVACILRLGPSLHCIVSMYAIAACAGWTATPMPGFSSGALPSTDSAQRGAASAVPGQ